MFEQIKCGEFVVVGCGEREDRAECVSAVTQVFGDGSLVVRSVFGHGRTTLRKYAPWQWDRVEHGDLFERPATLDS